MRCLFAALAALILSLVPLQTSASQGFGTVQNFGPSLVSDCPIPEGIALDPDTGTVYTAGTTGTAATVCVLSPTGNLVDTIPVPPGPSGFIALLGELFVPGEGLYVLDNDNSIDASSTGGRLLKVNPSTHAVTMVATGFSFPNGLARDQAGNLYVADSFKGIIFRVDTRGVVTIWSQDPLLSPHGFVGVNDLAFDRNQKFLYTDNSDKGQLLRIPLLADGSAGPAQVFATSAPIGASPGVPDGIMFDVRGNLYVCTPFLNQVQVISPDGQLITSLSGTGDNAMDFPASLVFDGQSLYISDFSLLDGGINSKLSRIHVPYPGLPLTED
jgi:sugar lactone lactonase YvrE